MTIRNTAILGVVLALCACDRGRDPAPAPRPEPTFADPRAAEASVPAALRPEYQHMVECEMKAMAAKGAEPAMDTATASRIAKAVREGRRAPDAC